MEYATYDSEDVIVYVNDANQPVSTTTIYNGLVPHTQAPPPPTTSSTPAPPAVVSPATSPSTTPVPLPEPSSSPVIAPKLESSTLAPAPSPVPQPTQAIAPASSPDPSPHPTSQDSGSSGPGFSSAVAYTPYNADQSCKSTSQVAADFQNINGYEVVRLYGTDCNQIGNVIAATHSKVKLFLGIFDINSIQSEVETISSVGYFPVFFLFAKKSSLGRMTSVAGGTMHFVFSKASMNHLVAQPAL